MGRELKHATCPRWEGRWAQGLRAPHHPGAGGAGDAAGALRSGAVARCGGVAPWALGLCLSAAGCAATPPSKTPPGDSPALVDFSSGTLRLHGLLWKPADHGPLPAVLFNHGSGGATADETAGMPITEAAARLAPLFTRRGYAFFYPFRRGHGPSADAAPFLQDRLASEEKAHGLPARQQLQDTVLKTEQLDDVVAALTFLKSVPGIDASRVVLMGHSFGGQLTLLAAARDESVRAAVTFAAAAGSWRRSEEVRRVLSDAVVRTRCPIMLVQWANDFSTEPSTALGAVKERAGSPPVVVIYPAVGSSPEDGHGGLYLAIEQWQPDVFRFLEQALRR